MTPGMQGGTKAGVSSTPQGTPRGTGTPRMLARAKASHDLLRQDCDDLDDVDDYDDCKCVRVCVCARASCVRACVRMSVRESACLSVIPLCEQKTEEQTEYTTINPCIHCLCTQAWTSKHEEEEEIFLEC
jgi:hypothetical protein